MTRRGKKRVVRAAGPKPSAPGAQVVRKRFAKKAKKKVAYKKSRK